MNYQAPWWLPDGNLQTLWAALHARRYEATAPVFRRERWATPDGDFVDVDRTYQAPTLPAARGSLPPEGALRLRPGKAGSAAPAVEETAPTLPAARGSLPPGAAPRLRSGKASPAAGT